MNTRTVAFGLRVEANGPWRKLAQWSIGRVFALTLGGLGPISSRVVAKTQKNGTRCLSAALTGFGPGGWITKDSGSNAED